MRNLKMIKGGDVAARQAISAGVTGAGVIHKYAGINVKRAESQYKSAHKQLANKRRLFF